MQFNIFHIFTVTGNYTKGYKRFSHYTTTWRISQPISRLKKLFSNTCGVACTSIFANDECFHHVQFDWRMMKLKTCICLRTGTSSWTTLIDWLH